MENDCSSVYDGLPASGNPIRLLELWPGDWTAPIECKLKPDPSSLEDEALPPYVTLSYVWGSRRAREEISLGGVPWNVTVNLASALRYLRDKTRMRLLWVDAMCINQSDDEERSHQVQMMGQVYSKCQEVAIFLGDAKEDRPVKNAWKKGAGRRAEFDLEAGSDGHGDEFLECLENTPSSLSKLGRAFRVFSLLQVLSRPRGRRVPDAKLFKPNDTAMEDVLEDLRVMLLSPWWQRIWVVQEIVLPPRAVVYWGGVNAPWSMFSRAANNIGTLSMSLKQSYKKVLGHFARTVIKIDNLQRRFRAEHGVDLHHLLTGFTSRRSTDDRDRIFGLLGLAKPGNSIVPDYGLEVIDVYQTAAVALLNESRTFSSLSSLIWRKRMLNLPSWVPDWTMEASFAAESTADTQIHHGVPEQGPRQKWVFEDAAQYWKYVADKLELLCKNTANLQDPVLRLPVGIKRSVQRLVGYANDLVRIQDCLSTLEKRCVGPNTRHLDIPWADFIDNTTIARIPWLKCNASLMMHVDHGRGIGFGDRAWFKFFHRPHQDHPLHRSMSLVAVWLGTVTMCGAPLLSWDNDASCLETIRDRWIASVPENRAFKSSTYLQGAIAKTLLQDSILDRGRLRPLSVEETNLLVPWLHKTFKTGLQVSNDTGADDSPRTQETFRAFDQTLRHCTVGRTMFVIVSSKLAIGLGPGTMAVGDEIFLLPGTTCYGVLRSKDSRVPRIIDCYELVGNCYLSSQESDARVPPDTLAPRDYPNGCFPFEMFGDDCPAEVMEKLSPIPTRLVHLL
ncbi:heterokaryon incompatibility protein-domain-containing protein [Cercophora scortea]|uniref:Heterokaryon incompatibility protein-domain-containing protein n=1 Tax=Cercophora scortea TaxID=314031 RepID=A0AAE0I8B1_9PEZI|nr:heterokaryon incompatibility protein-domain-containing protein [Cercophora scortea]